MPIEPSASQAITFQPVAKQDEEFLLRLYSSTRTEEVKAWGWGEAQAQAFLKMQFTARQRSYQASFPNGEYRLVLMNEAPIGQEIVERGGSIHLIDIALLPQFRGAGIGTRLLQDLIEESRAKRLPVELKVLRNNRAVRLYERMGFVKTSEDETYYDMRRQPD